jgi:hypothetical protein
MDQHPWAHEYADDERGECAADAESGAGPVEVCLPVHPQAHRHRDTIAGNGSGGLDLSQATRFAHRATFPIRAHARASRGCSRAVDRWRTLSPEARGRAVAAVLAAPAALLSFLLYLGWAVQDPFAWNETQQAWGRSFNAIGIFLSIRRLFTGLGKNYWGLRDALFCVAFLVLLAVAARAKVAWPGRRRWPWIVFGLAIVLLPLASGSMESDARFGLLALPIYWGLAVAARRRWLERGLLALSAVLLLGATATIPLIFP